MKEPARVGGVEVCGGGRTSETKCEINKRIERQSGPGRLERDDECQALVSRDPFFPWHTLKVR
jgi:hypothetical protein